MDQWKHENDSSETPSNRLQNSHSEIRQRVDVDLTDALAAKKILKADREKLRRDRLNEQFQELGSMLDPERHKNDKSTILTDTIQTLKDLNSEVDKLKTEHGSLSEETCELMQEKNELREEKASLRSDIENLKAHYQQSYRLSCPWAAYDPSLVMVPPFSFPGPLPTPPGPVPVYPTMQPFPFFGSQPVLPPNHCSSFIPYPTPAIPHIDQPSTASALPSCASVVKRDPKVRSSNQENISNFEKVDGPNDVITDLELKIPGSNVQKDFSAGERKGKQPLRFEKNIKDRNGSSRYSSSQSFHGSSSNSVGDM